MKKLVALAVIAVLDLAVAAGCSSQSAKDSKYTSPPSLAKPTMTPVQAQRNAKMIERHVSND